jgi:hypothetical protein
MSPGRRPGAGVRVLARGFLARFLPLRLSLVLRHSIPLQVWWSRELLHIRHFKY